MTAAERIRAAASVACRPWPRHVLPAAEWAALAASLATEPVPLAALWADTAQVHALFTDTDGTPLLASTPVEDGRYLALSPTCPAASRFERMVQDLWGHLPVGADDLRPLLDHGQWGHSRPMAPRHGPPGGAEEPVFLQPADPGMLHQLALGPVHAAIAEPVHLRVHARGDTMAALEARLGYAHKGTLLLMRGKSPRAAARFAARLCGDSTVAHAIAFAAAAEAVADVSLPPRAIALRALMLELERIANHLATLAGVGGSAGGRFGLHREVLARAAAVAFGHRLMMDCVVPGGLATDIAAAGPAAITAALDGWDAEWPSLAGAALADSPVAAAELPASAGQVRAALASLPGGPVTAVMTPAAGEGLGTAASHRGPVWHWLRLDGGLIAAAFAADPAWHNWPGLERAAAGADVATLPDLLRRSRTAASPVDL